MTKDAVRVRVSVIASMRPSYLGLLDSKNVFSTSIFKCLIVLRLREDRRAVQHKHFEFFSVQKTTEIQNVENIEYNFQKRNKKSRISREK